MTPDTDIAQIPQPPASGGSSEVPPPFSEPMPPWEYPEQWGSWWRALSETLRLVLFHPSSVFSRMAAAGNLSRAFGYAMIMNAIATLISWPIMVAWQVFQHKLLSMVTEISPDLSLPQETVSPFIMVALFPLFSIVGAVISVLVLAALSHLALLMVKGATHPFETTFRVVCYAQGSTILWSPIPCIGPLIGLGWEYIVLVHGLSEQHRITRTRVNVAFGLLLLIFNICLCAALVPLVYYIQNMQLG